MDFNRQLKYISHTKCCDENASLHLEISNLYGLKIFYM